jgi:hypothetical protein
MSEKEESLGKSAKPNAEAASLASQSAQSQLSARQGAAGTAGQEDFDGEEDSAEFPVKRKSRWASSLLALQYVSSISKDNFVRLRVSDRVTSIFLLLAVIAAVLSLVLRPLSDIRIPVACLCDALVGIMLLLYMANRFGVLTTLPPRQALLAWELILVSCIVGIFLTVNFFILVAVLVSATSLPLPH